MGLSVSTHHSYGAVALTLTGEVDLGTVDSLETEIWAALQTDAAGVVLDLSGVTFLDSTGISALLKGRRLADERGKGFRVGGAHDMVREVLEITGVWDHLSGDSRQVGH